MTEERGGLRDCRDSGQNNKANIHPMFLFTHLYHNSKIQEMK